jgi:hypothetical protein
LLVTVTEPVRAPAAVGLNVTLIVQLAPTARLVPHVFVCAKSPVAAIELIVAALVPPFVIVVVWAAVVEPTTVAAKPRLAGLAESAGPGAVPLPLRLTFVGPLGSLVVTVSVPVRDPFAVGWKVTLTEHEAFAARLAPHVFVCAKSPVIETPETVSELEPVFVIVVVWAPLVVPVVTEPKLSAVGLACTPTGGGFGGVGHGPQYVVLHPELPPPSTIVKPTPQLYWPAGPSTCVATTFVNLADPPTCSCTTNVPTLAMLAFEMFTFVMLDPETN